MRRQSRNEAKDTFSAGRANEFREMLLKERESLMRQIRSLSAASLTSNHQAGEELADVGSDDFIRETELHLMGEESHRLALINTAIENLDAGSYGTCVDCSKPIAVGRLKAQPYARLCIDCKTVREQNGGVAPEGVEDTGPVEE